MLSSSTTCNLIIMTLTILQPCQTRTSAAVRLQKAQIALNDVCFSSSSASVLLKSGSLEYLCG